MNLIFKVTLEMCHSCILEAFYGISCSCCLCSIAGRMMFDAISKLLSEKKRCGIEKPFKVDTRMQ